MNLFILLSILGIVQGISEFLPISSSGHLVLFQQIPAFATSLLNIDKLFVNVALHFASLVAIFIYFRKDISELFLGSIKSLIKKDFKSKELLTVYYLIIGTIPVVFSGLFLDEYFDTFNTLGFVSIVLIINGFILIGTKKIPIKDRQLNEVGILRSLIIGFFQAIAILPGLSRSGMTIAGGILSGMTPFDAARFSFFLAIPAISGASLLKGIKAYKQGLDMSMIVPLTVGMIISFFVALVSLKVLFYFLKKVRVDIFGYYTITVGIAGLIIKYLM